MGFFVPYSACSSGQASVQANQVSGIMYVMLVTQLCWSSGLLSCGMIFRGADVVTLCSQIPKARRRTEHFLPTQSAIRESMDGVRKGM